MTAITTAAHIDAQTQEDLMRQAGIWTEHSTLIEDDLPARPLAAVQAEKHQLDRYTQLVAARAAEHAPQCLAQIEEPATLAGTTIEQYARMFDAACEALGQVSDCLGINSDINPGAEPIIAAIEQLRAGKTHPVLDDRWKARMLDGRAIARDEMGLGDHPELPLLDEGMMPRSFFAALGLELTHTSAEEQLDGDVLGAMSEAVNWTDWQPTAPQGKGWKLVSIFDTEDGPVAWWLRELPEAEDGTTTIRNLQAEAEKLEARIARLSRAGAAPAAVAPQGEYPHEQMDAMALARYKVVPSHASMLWSHAVVAGHGAQQLYVGREVECQNMARKFAGAFLDGAFAFHSMAAAPTAQAAPALEAPPTVTGRTVPRNDDERAAAQFFADNPSAAVLAWPLYLARDKSLALEAPAAPEQAAQVSRQPDYPEGHVLRNWAQGWNECAAYVERAALAAAPQAPAAPMGVVGWVKDECTGPGAFDPMFVRGAAPLPAGYVANYRPVVYATAPAAPAVDADPLGLRDVGEAFMQAIERNSDALKAVGWLGPMDCPSEIVGDLLNLLEEANTTSALGEWVATLEVDSGGGLDYETVPPCTLPPGCYPLYRAAQAAAKGADAA